MRSSREGTDRTRVQVVRAARSAARVAGLRPLESAQQSWPPARELRIGPIGRSRAGRIMARSLASACCHARKTFQLSNADQPRRVEAAPSRCRHRIGTAYRAGPSADPGAFADAWTSIERRAAAYPAQTPAARRTLIRGSDCLDGSHAAGLSLWSCTVMLRADVTAGQPVMRLKAARSGCQPVVQWARMRRCAQRIDAVFPMMAGMPQTSTYPGVQHRRARLAAGPSARQPPLPPGPMRAAAGAMSPVPKAAARLAAPVGNPRTRARAAVATGAPASLR